MRNSTSLAAVATATGHTLDTVRARGVSFCERNPIQPRGEFDLAQADAPDDLDQTLSLRDLAAEAAVLSHDPDALDDKLTHARAAAALQRQVVVFVRREPVEDGVQLVGRVGESRALVSPILSIEAADALEPAMRAAVFAYAAALAETDALEALAA